MEKPFQGLATFLKTPVQDMSRPIGVLGVPFDGATSNRAGARGGPNAIRKASMMLTDGAHPLFGIDCRELITDLGDVAVSNIDLTRSMDQITATVEQYGYGITPRRRLLAMGGDHTITTGLLRAIAPKNPDLFVLHLDAHCDTWPDHFGEPMGHGTWVRNVIDERLVTPHNFLQVGIRSPVDPETRDWLPMRGGGVFTAREALSEKLFVLRKMIPSDQPLYISFDIDALDPAYAPGTGTPEIAGLTPHFCLDLLETLFSHNIVGMDLVEVNPAYDPTEITALAGATMLWTVASMMAANLSSDPLPGFHE